MTDARIHVIGRWHPDAGQDHPSGEGQDPGVKTERPMVDIPDVQLEALVEVEKLAPGVTSCLLDCSGV